MIIKPIAFFNVLIIVAVIVAKVPYEVQHEFGKKGPTEK